MTVLMKKCLLVSSSLALLLTLAGCVSDSATPTTKPAATTAPARPAPLTHDDLLIPAAKVNAIAKGMKAETVRELLGAPNNVRAFAAGGEKSEIWVYRISVTDRAQQTPTSTRDVPGWDPISNKEVVTKEPVYQVEHIRTFRTLELLIVDGRLIERKPGVDQERSFY
jgi:hypothetical protein